MIRNRRGAPPQLWINNFSGTRLELTDLGIDPPEPEGPLLRLVITDEWGASSGIAIPASHLVAMLQREGIDTAGSDGLRERLVALADRYEKAEIQDWSPAVADDIREAMRASS